MVADVFSREEKALVDSMLAQIVAHSAANREHAAYYDGSFSAKLLSISTPEHIGRMLKTVSGWAGTAVDVLEERLDFLGYADDDLVDAFETNALDEESGQVHLDTLIYGIGFVSVTGGGAGEPEQLIRGHDANNTTGLLNPRTRLFDAALTREVKNGEVVGVDLWLPDQVVKARRERHGSPWEIVDRQRNNLGAVQIVPFVNRSRIGDRGGKSEVTAPLRRYADAAVRTLISMDVNREFFSAPQRYAIGMSADDFVGPDGRPLNPWQILTGRVWSTGAVGDDEREPKLGEFAPQPPGPFLDQIEGLAQLAAAEAGLPSHYFGLRGDQATSADAIRAMEARLVKRAERRQKSFGRSWSQVSRLVRAGRDGERVDDVEASRTRWGNPATPTVGATMDAMVKAVQAGLAPGNSRVIWDRVGFTPEEQRLLEREVAQQRAAQNMASLAQAASAGVGAVNPDAPVEIVSAGIAPGRSRAIMDMIGLTPEQQEILEADWSRDTSRSLGEMLRTRQVAQDPAVDAILATRTAEDDTQAVEGSLDIPAGADADTLAKKFDALGKAIRAGVDPDDAAARLGLPGLHFTGAIPVSLRVPKSEGEGLEEK